ncbi:MAG: DUF1622 domain-containing protein [Crocosphaera sp.]|nr:DUF1622 domain-containing protein [Crocosphaera sp.]
MELLGSLEDSLRHFVTLVRLSLEFISVLCVVYGIIVSLQLVIVSSRRLSFPFLELRLRFGSSLALALEFQLGSDILSTTIAPSFEALGKLAAITLIRTFLNYFLTKELEEERALKVRQTD